MSTERNKNEEELISMAALAKPVNRAFELSSSKTTKFFEDSKKGTSQKAIDRAAKYTANKKSK